MKLDGRLAGRLLRRVSALMEVRGDDQFKVRAMANAGRAVDRLEGDVGGMALSGELLNIRGVGKGSVAILVEAAQGNAPEVLVELEQDIPQGIREILGIRGLGPKKVRALWQELSVMSPGELEYACLENRLVDLKGFGRKSQESVLESVRFLLRTRERIHLHDAHACAQDLAAKLSRVDGVDETAVVGELRRGCETVSLVEFLVSTANPNRVLEHVAEELGGAVVAACAEGTFADGCRWRVSAVPQVDFVGSVFKLTGPQDHVEAVLQCTAARGWNWTGRAFENGGKSLEMTSDDDVYTVAGCEPVVPVLRGFPGIIDRALNSDVPKIVPESRLRGALHNHTRYSDGGGTVEEMAKEAASLGWRWIGIADHSPVAVYANGVDSERLRDQWRRIDAFNASQDRITVLKGIEADILRDGALDIPEGCAGGLEYVVASVHSAFNLDRELQTRRLVEAVRHPACRVLGHPTGRLLLARPGYEADYDAVLEACSTNGVALEVNANPHRLDANADLARRALAAGVKLIVNPDAHSTAGLAHVQWGWLVAQAAGAESGDLLNTLSTDELLQWLRR